METESPFRFKTQTQSDQVPLLEVKHLTKTFGGKPRRQILSGKAAIRAVDDVSFHIGAGETLGLVGESGCGKSTTARLVMRLLEPISGSIFFQGRDITSVNRRDLRELRRSIQMVFQDPYDSLHPRMQIKDILSEPFRIHGYRNKRIVRDRILELLELVGLDPAHLKRYPFEFSGGQRQRIGIARALALEPSLVVLDEPVSALDVSIQAQILNLLKRLQHDQGLTFLFIAHDLAVVRHVSQRIAVMYLGKIVEIADRDRLYRSPNHPYTQALLSAVPRPEVYKSTSSGRIILRGEPPSPTSPPTGCRFSTRCWRAEDICRQVEPQLSAQTDDATAAVACHFPGQ